MAEGVPSESEEDEWEDIDDDGTVHLGPGLTIAEEEIATAVKADPRFASVSRNRRKRFDAIIQNTASWNALTLQNLRSLRR